MTTFSVLKTTKILKVTGWAIGEDGGRPSDPTQEAASLYAKLEHVIGPLFFRRPLAFAEVMRSTIALNASFYNAQRMVDQYMRNAYAAQEANCSPESPGKCSLARRSTRDCE